MPEYTANEDHLGPIILRCRPRPLREMMGDLGFMGKYYFWVGPLGCAILAMFLSFPIVGIAVANKVPPPILIHPVWGPVTVCWWLVWFGAGLWFAYVLPRGDSLALYEKGFRCRISLRHWEVQFEKLREIRLGQKTKESYSLISHMLIPGYATRRFAKAVRATSTTLLFKSSKQSRIPTLLVRFEYEDLKEFFGYLMDHHPDLFVKEA